MSNDKIIRFNGREINYGKLTDESIIKLYGNIMKKQVSLYKKILTYKEDLGINDEEVDEMLEKFEKSLL